MSASAAQRGLAAACACLRACAGEPAAQPGAAALPPRPPADGADKHRHDQSEAKKSKNVVGVLAPQRAAAHDGNEHDLRRRGRAGLVGWTAACQGPPQRSRSPVPLLPSGAAAPATHQQAHQRQNPGGDENPLPRAAGAHIVLRARDEAGQGESRVGRRQCSGLQKALPHISLPAVLGLP